MEMLKKEYKDMYENGLHTNQLGAKQSNLEARFDLIDPIALFEMANVLHYGAVKYGEDDNWRAISVDDHLNHALAHIFKYLLTREKTELTHALCRMMFAVAKYMRPDYLGKFKPLRVEKQKSKKKTTKKR